MDAERGISPFGLCITYCSGHIIRGDFQLTMLRVPLYPKHYSVIEFLFLYHRVGLVTE